MEAAPKTTRQRMKASERKSKIVDVAVWLFSQKGYDGVSTKTIAEGAGISEATVFRHFPSKESLYAEAFQRVMGSSTADLVAELEAVANTQDDELLFRTLFREMLRGYDQNGNSHRMIQHAYLTQRGADNQQLHDRLRTIPFFAFLSRYVAGRVKRVGSSARSTPSWR